MRLLVCLLPLVALLTAGTCGPTTPDQPIDDTPCTQAMCGAVPSVPPRMCQDTDGVWTVEEVTGCSRDEDTGVCGWQVNRCDSAEGNPALACTLPNSCPDGSACLGGFCHAREMCNEGQDTCAQGSLCCLTTNACVPADHYDRCPLPAGVAPTR